MSDDDDLDPMLSIADVAKILNLSTKWVRQSVIQPNGGDLPAIQIGKYWRIRRSDLKEYIEKKYKISGTRPVGH